MNSKQKGARGEREWASFCRDHGYMDCRRSQQFCGDAGDDDVKGLPYIFCEVKRVQSLNLDLAMSKATAQCGGKIPIVAHRKDRGKWRVTMNAEDWFKLYREWEASEALKGSEQSPYEEEQP